MTKSSPIVKVQGSLRLVSAERFTDKELAMESDRALGCLIGGAYGDSLGAAGEFLSLAKIRGKYGDHGIVDLDRAFGHPAGVITDDTQMAIATARGILADPSAEDPIILRNIWAAYLEWFKTQGTPGEGRAAGITVSFSLLEGVMGSRQEPINRSAGCGGIMRVHPIGLVLQNDPVHAFWLGMDSAALTHGDPDGYVPAGALAALIACLASGQDFSAAVGEMSRLLLGLREDERNGTMRAVRTAFETPISNDCGEMIDRAVGRLGGQPGGWLGHDALAIALYAARVALDDPLRAVRIAVNHSGDSDSTGAITGAIVGTIHGPDAFESALRDQGVKLEREDELRELSQKLLQQSQEVRGGSC